MQTEYLSRLSEPVQQFTLEVEEGAGIEIEVILDPDQNEGGTTGQGKLAVVINAKSIQLLAPTNGYFPEGAVSNEELVRLLFLTFPEIPKSRAALKYINSMTGTCQKPIP